MFESKEEKKRKATRERVARYREKKKSQTVTADVTNVLQPAPETVTTSTKMICKCKYYTRVNGELVCVQCGQPAPKIHDKIRRGIQFK